jgi:flagellar biosynthesis/type III secretory pathway protein FliH
VLDSLRQAIPQTVRELENNLVSLAFESVKKIVADMPISAEMIERVIREALGQVENSAEVTIFVHPEDLALLRRLECPLLNGSTEGQSLRFSSSSDVTRGGCLLQTRFGLLDARRETKIEQLQQAINA